MPDQVSTLATALSASITAGTVTPTQLTTLSTAIVGGGQALAVSRASRRAGILNGVLNPLTLPLGATVASIAQSWSEVVEANVFLASAQSVDGSLNILRAFDTSGPAFSDDRQYSGADRDDLTRFRRGG